MLVEFLIEKLFQSFSARTELAPMHDAYVARRVVNDPLDQVFVCQVPILCIDLRHNILMSATKKANRASHFEPATTHHLVSRNTTLNTQYLYLGVFL